MARPKNAYNKDEVEEILKLKLEELLGVRKKLTPNNVWNFNKELVDRGIKSEYTKEVFVKYGYQFWCVGGYGRQRIEELKEEKEDFQLMGKIFEPKVEDIVILVDKYHKKPDELVKRMIKVFEQDRKKIKLLETENNDLRKKVEDKNKKLENFEEAFNAILLASSSDTTSLRDVYSLKKSDDPFVYDELKLMFSGKSILPKETPVLEQLNNISEITRISRRNETTKEERRKAIEKDWLS